MATPGTALPGANVPASSHMASSGAQGIQGIVGPTGPPAVATTTQSFVVPAIGSTVNVTVTDASWMQPGQMLAIAGAGGTNLSGTLQLQSKAGNVLTLLNPPGPVSYPLADGTQPGLLAQLSGAPTDYVGGDNACHPLPEYYGTDTTNNTNYAVSVASSFSLRPGARVWVTPSNACLANPTLNVNGTGAIPIVNRANIALSAGEIGLRTFGVLYDGTSWRVITSLTRLYSAVNPGNVTVECAGYDAVAVFIQFTTNTPTGLTLAHVAEGTDISVNFANAYTAALTYWIQATNPAGTVYGGVNFIPNTSTAGVAAISITSPQSLTNGQNALYNGKAVGGTVGPRVVLK